MDKNKKIIVIAAAVVAVLALAAGLLWWARARASANVYRAVFLTNGQVYFGKVYCKNAGYVTLRDIYYLQTKQPLQNQTGAESANQSDLALVKLGKELHRPKDMMEINREHILFMEELADDSKIITAIVNYQNGNKK